MTRSTKNSPILFCQRILFWQSIAIALLLCAAGCTTAKDTTMLIDEIPLFSAGNPIGEGQYTEQKTALIQALEQHWQGKYRVAGQRFFVYPAPAKWVILDKFVSNHVQDKMGGSPEYDEHGEPDIPGFTAVDVWKIGMLRPRYVGVTMAHQPLPDGSVLYAYLEVEKL